MTDDIQLPEKGDVDYGAHCDVCKERITDGCGAWDEDDTFWCVPCMLKWELEHGRQWENGQPMKEKTK